MATKLTQWTARLTGFSTPWFGASWQPTVAERDIAAGLLAHFEDRRVLYSPSEAEVAQHCVHSVLEIRHLLSNALTKLGGTGVLADHLRALAAESRRFLDRVGPYERIDNSAVRNTSHYLSWDFLDALGQLRGIFGVHIAMIAARYDLTVHGNLKDVLPAKPMKSDLDGSL